MYELHFKCLVTTNVISSSVLESTDMVHLHHGRKFFASVHIWEICFSSRSVKLTSWYDSQIHKGPSNEKNANHINESFFQVHFLSQIGCKLMNIKDHATLFFSSVSTAVCPFILQVFTECLLPAKIWRIKNPSTS